MLSFLALLLAVCVSSRAVPTLRPPGGDTTDTASDRVTRTHTVGSFSNASLLSISSHTPAPHAQRSEGFGRESLPGSPRPPAGLQGTTLRLGAPDEDRTLGVMDTSTTTPSGDSTGPTLLDAADTWTEAVHLRTGEVSVSSQELGTEATMSSEDLPLIFEPFEDVTVSMDTGHTSSDVRLSGTSGARPSVTDEQTGDDITQSAVTRPSEHLESKEEEEDSDEEEEESEEDLMENTITPHTRPPYSLIPPPPIWVQRNQGLVRSWVELIREKAGYVSGMLAPVGIGIAGALLLVGALYSIRLIHRRRRDSFKHQRRKPPREVRSGPDNAMLLADSSEDEF